MFKIKVVWRDNPVSSESYVIAHHRCTDDIDKAKEFPLSVAIGIGLDLLKDDLVKNVEFIKDNELYRPKKKIFRIWKMLLQDIDDLHDVGALQEDVKYLINSKDNWMTKCEGKTREECRKLGYQVNDDWMVEEE